MDYVKPLQRTGRFRDPDAAHAHQMSNELLGDMERIRMGPIMSHEQPARQALVYGMEMQTARIRRELQDGHMHIALQASLECAAANQLSVEWTGSDAPGGSRTAHQRMQGDAEYSQGHLRPQHPFIAHHGDFKHRSVPGGCRQR